MAADRLAEWGVLLSAGPDRRPRQEPRGRRWALSVTDPATRHAIATAASAAAARTIAAEAPRREGRAHARVAIMTRLLHATYDQHSELAEILLATDDAALIYDDMDSTFWGDNTGRGRNWAGRLLELVRSERQARQAGILDV